jgi:hypothetical protein
MKDIYAKFQFAIPHVNMVIVTNQIIVNVNQVGKEHPVKFLNVLKNMIVFMEFVMLPMCVFVMKVGMDLYVITQSAIQYVNMEHVDLYQEYVIVKKLDTKVLDVKMLFVLIVTMEPVYNRLMDLILIFVIVMIITKNGVEQIVIFQFVVLDVMNMVIVFLLLMFVNVMKDGKEIFAMNQFVSQSVPKVKDNVLLLDIVIVSKDGLELFVIYLFVMIVTMEYVVKMINVNVSKDGIQKIQYVTLLSVSVKTKEFVLNQKFVIVLELDMKDLHAKIQFVVLLVINVMVPNQAHVMVMSDGLDLFVMTQSVNHHVFTEIVVNQTFVVVHLDTMVNHVTNQFVT